MALLTDGYYQLPSDWWNKADGTGPYSYDGAGGFTLYASTGTAVAFDSTFTQGRSGMWSKSDGTGPYVRTTTGMKVAL